MCILMTTCILRYILILLCFTLYLISIVVVVVCHKQLSSKSMYPLSMFELFPPDSAIHPLVTSPSDVRCKRTSVSRLVVTLQILYRCHLVRRTPYSCSDAVDGSVLIVAVMECIVVFGSVSAPPPIFGVGALSVICCCIGDEYPNLLHVCAYSGGFTSCLRRI